MNRWLLSTSARRNIGRHIYFMSALLRIAIELLKTSILKSTAETVQQISVYSFVFVIKWVKSCKSVVARGTRVCCSSWLEAPRGLALWACSWFEAVFRGLRVFLRSSAATLALRWGHLNSGAWPQPQLNSGLWPQQPSLPSSAVHCFQLFFTPSRRKCISYASAISNHYYFTSAIISTITPSHPLPSSPLPA